MRKLAIASLFFSSAIYAAHYLLPHKLLPVFFAIALASVPAGLLFKGIARRRFVIAAVSAAVGLIWSFTHTQLFIAPAERLHEQIAFVTAVVKDYPSKRDVGGIIELTLRQTDMPPLGVRLYDYSDYNPNTIYNLEPGDTIEFTASFILTDDPGSLGDYFTSRGIFLIAFLESDITVISQGGSFSRFPLRLSMSAADMLEQIYPDDVSPFMQALLTGRRDKLYADEALTSALSAAGISHIVAISGMHVTFLMGMLGVFVRRKRLFAFVSMPILLLFMAMTGFTPSVTRAGIMQLFLICAPLFRRESDSPTSLSAAMLVLLAVNPYACASVGLNLSFAATLGIILLSGKLIATSNETLRESELNENKPLKSAARFVTSSLAVTAGALLFTIPLTALYFGYVSLASPIANLLTLWAVSYAFPIGMVSSILGFISEPLGTIAAFPVTLLVRYVTGTARILAAMPNSAVYVSNPLIIIWLVYVYAMLTASVLLRVTIRRLILPCCLAIISLCSVILLTPLMPAPGGTTVTALDVGQGQSIVITAGEYTAIVDCGGESGVNAGEAAHEFLSNQGRTSIDLLILTHFHADHANGVEYLFGRTKVSALVIPDPDGSALADDIIELARKRGTDIIYVTETLGVALGDTELIIYPPLGYTNDNDSGLAILHLSDGLRTLITGDMGSAAERRLLRFAALPDIDLLIAGHHGSRYSVCEELLSAVTPELAVISVGSDNVYGHPAEVTLARLEAAGAAIYRTDETGNITVTAQTKTEE